MFNNEPKWWKALSTVDMAFIGFIILLKRTMKNIKKMCEGVFGEIWVGTL